MRQIDFIILHCTATLQTASVESIQEHWKSNGWKEPGYHYVIKPNGAVVNLQPIEKVSNGVKGFNHNSVNISYIGGVDRNNKAIDNRTDPQKKTMYEIVKNLKDQFPNARIKGHRDFSDDTNGNGIIDPWERMKECPCFEVSDWVKQNNL